MENDGGGGGKGRKGGERRTGSRVTGKRRAELNDRVLQQLDELRATMAEMMERYELRVGSRLVELSTAVRGDASLGVEPQPLTVKTAMAILAAIDAVQIRPRKGRAKDFARLEALTETLAEIAPPPP